MPELNSTEWEENRGTEDEWQFKMHQNDFCYLEFYFILFKNRAEYLDSCWLNREQEITNHLRNVIIPFNHFTLMFISWKVAIEKEATKEKLISRVTDFKMQMLWIGIIRKGPGEAKQDWQSVSRL